jgi:hypothetical protein
MGEIRVDPPFPPLLMPGLQPPARRGLFFPAFEYPGPERPTANPCKSEPVGLNCQRRGQSA